MYKAQKLNELNGCIKNTSDRIVELYMRLDKLEKLKIDTENLEEENESKSYLKMQCGVRSCKQCFEGRKEEKRDRKEKDIKLPNTCRDPRHPDYESHQKEEKRDRKEKNKVGDCICSCPCMSGCKCANDDHSHHESDDDSD